MEPERETLYLVPHTHWDREWYEPFQRFRLRLVDLLDDVVSRAEANPDFRFTLDGQLAAVDDYLEVRPEQRERVSALVRSGQLAIGPWSVLADEFLCSGENLVRNLERGLARAAKLGGGMLVGYLPDQFGHCAQMPQILARAGIDQACLWRGVPAEVTSHGFRWRAPDGSHVRCEYLPGGYGNAAYLLADPERVAERTEAHAARMRSWFGDDPILAMYGTDHSAPLPSLMDTVAALEASGAPVRLQLSTLDEYLGRLVQDDGLPVWTGELRSHARANILPGVLSCRIHLKRAMASAERMVERYAEPFAALWSEDWPERFLDMAWSRLISSACHDSVTGCGADATAEQVAARIAEAEQLGSAVRDRVVGGLARRTPSDAVLVVNPTPAPRSGVVEVTVPVDPEWSDVALELPDGQTVATQLVAHNERTLLSLRFPADEVAAALLHRSFGQEMFGRRVQRLVIDAGAREATVEVGRLGDPSFDMDGAADQLDATAREVGGEWTLRVCEEPLRTVLAKVPAPALGHLSVRPVRDTGTLPEHPVTVDGEVLDNGLLRVGVEPGGTVWLRSADGTTVTGVGRIVDGGDVGDLYNYAPPADDQLISEPSEVVVTVAETGPVLAALMVTRTYHWPGDGADRSSRAESITVRMRVELRAGERFCRLSLEFDNRCTDHRVRLHIPLPTTASESHAEGQFAVVTRGLSGEGGHGEEPLPTFPAYRFVDAGGVAVLLDHVTEYEVTDGGQELALTLLRATGQISRSIHPYRVEPAGPEIATPAAQCLGLVRTRIAVMPHPGHWSDDGVLSAAEDFWCDLVTAPGDAAEGGALHTVSGLSVTGDGVTMTSLRRRDDVLELRVVALHPEPTTAVIEGVGWARRVDLLGRPGEELSVTDGRLSLPLRPWEIATVQLTR